MDSYIATEQAYKNGYKKGSKETAQKLVTKIKQALNNVETIVSDNNMNTLQPNIGYNMKQVDDLLDEIERQVNIQVKCDDFDRDYIVGKVHGMPSMLDSDNEVKE